MAAVVSAARLSKPGAWALDAEESEAELRQLQGPPPSEFPSLSAAATAGTNNKASKKKKAQKLSLAEFTTGGALTPAEMLALPSGPRKRTPEELEQSRMGSSNSRWSGTSGMGSCLSSSRADEVDNWAAAKKSTVSATSRTGFEGRSRERENKGGSSSFDSHSRADESSSWVSNKSCVVAGSSTLEPGRKYGASNTFGAGRTFDRVSSNISGGSISVRNADSDTWGKKKVEGGSGTGLGARPRLNLKPRTLPVPVSSTSNAGLGSGSPGSSETSIPKAKGSNPFGEARPREEVLAAKGEDWRRIDEKLESMKIKDREGTASSASSADTMSEKSWRSSVVASRPSSADGIANSSDVGEN